MANIRLIKGRIKSARNIAQITKAMELVSASKMKKAQAAALAGKLYAQKIYEMVIRLSTKVDMTQHPLLKKPEVLSGKRLVVLISTNKGLCGGLNASLFRFFLQQYPKAADYDCITLGKKGASFVTQIGGSLKADFSDSSFQSVVPAVIELVTAGFVAGTYDSVELVYNDFMSVIKQVPKRKVIMPLSIESMGVTDEHQEVSEFLIEPTVEEVFESLLPHYVENQVRDAVLEAEASEHSARMMAMRNATDNAMSLTDELTLVYNKARQEKITYEITDLITAQMAISS